MTVIDFTAFIGRLATASGETILPFFRTALTVEDKVAFCDRLIAAGPLPEDVKQAFDHNRMASVDHHKPAFERCGGGASAQGQGRGAGHGHGCGRGCGCQGHGRT